MTRTRTLVAVLAVGGLGAGGGWALRDWWAPPPAEVFARYLEAGNAANWLLCEGGAGQRLVSTNGVPICDLKFWLDKARP